MTWLEKIRDYDTLKQEVEMLRDNLNATIKMNFDALHSHRVEVEKERLESDMRHKDIEYQELKKKYEKVCQENRHLEREIERLKLYRV